MTTPQAISEQKRKELIGAWFDNPKNKPAVFADAHNLITIINSQIEDSKREKVTIHPDTLNAAHSILARLDVAIKQWEKNTSDHLRIEVKQFRFTREYETSILKQTQDLLNGALLNDCRAAINHNKNMLMKDPGFWEQIKESINNFTQKYGKFNFFEVKQTLFALRKGMDKSIEKITEATPIRPK